MNAKEILSDADEVRLVPEAIRRNWQAMVDSEKLSGAAVDPSSRWFPCIQRMPAC